MLCRLPLLLCAVALVACNREPPAAATQAPVAAAPVTAPAATKAQIRHVPLAALKETGDAHINGYGDLRFGMTADGAKKAWGGELNGQPGAGEICYYLTPKSVASAREFGFMIESDKFVRYDVGNDKEVAPGGGKRGMGIDEIRRLYPGRIEETPHKYVKGGNYLRIKTDDDNGGVVLFETNADGKVTSWRVGQVPQVDYAEGCA